MKRKANPLDDKLHVQNVLRKKCKKFSNEMIISNLILSKFMNEDVPRLESDQSVDDNYQQQVTNFLKQWEESKLNYKTQHVKNIDLTKMKE